MQSMSTVVIKADEELGLYSTVFEVLIVFLFYQ